MSASGPLEGGNPFEGMPIFGDLARLFQSQGPVNWDVARQIGLFVAAEGTGEPNVDPGVRFRLEELARVAELNVAEATALPTSETGRPVTVKAVNRSTWAAETLAGYRPLLEKLAASLAPKPSSRAEEPSDGSEEFLGNLLQVMAPTILGLQLGLMVGHLSRRSFGQYDLPIPRLPGDELLAVPANVDAFAGDWSLPADDVRLWACLDGIAHHAVITRPHVRERLVTMLGEYAEGFEPDPDALAEKLADVDPTDQASLERVFGDPVSFLGSVESEAQRALRPRLEALTSTIEGYVDYVMDTVGGRLIGSYGPLSEALRRRRVEAETGDRFVERLFGLELGQPQYDRGERFVRGIVERTGQEGLTRLWESERTLPTPPEIEAPGLWWERINLPD